MTTGRYSSDRKGPAKSTEITVHGAAGSGVVSMGSRCVCFGFEAWHGMQLCTVYSTSFPRGKVFYGVFALLGE